jgi:acetyl-CoA carboxylase biotin carboxyl carrier protein
MNDGHLLELFLRIQAREVSVDITFGDQITDARSGIARTIDAKTVDTRPAEVTTTVEPAEPAPVAEASAKAEFLTSPGVGVFYHAREPSSPPFVSVGSLVQPGQQIGIIEAMKLMIPVEADRGGRISEVLKGNGEPVEYGEPLFALQGEDV